MYFTCVATAATAVDGSGRPYSAVQATQRLPASRWIVSLFSFLLLCLSLVAVSPARAGDFCGPDCVISEDFDDATSGGADGIGTLPTGWENVNGENTGDNCYGDACDDWWVNDSSDNESESNPDIQVLFDHTDGLGNYLFVASDGNDNDTVSVLTPTFALDASNEPYATFFVYSDYTGNTASRANELYVDVLDGSDNVVQSSVAIIGDTDINHWRPAYVDLDGTASGTYRLRLRWESSFDQADESGLHDIAIDDFAVVADREAAPGTGNTPDQTYIFPAPENDILEFLEIVNTNPSIQAEDPVETYTAIAIARDGAILYYDEWEDDYENDITNPSQTFGNTSGGPSPITTSTQIWGDGYPENGYPPGYPHDVLSLGDVIILREPEIDTTPSSNLAAFLDHDARDTLASTEEIAITHAFWAANSETLNAGALELFPVARWGGNFELPMGEDIDPGDLDASTSCGDDNPFQEVALFVMADTDGTSVEVDYDGDGGTPDFSDTLDRGESRFIGLDDSVNVGATVTATGGNVQVHVFTADVSSNYGSRFYTLLPRDQFTDNYVAPFDSSTGGDGELIIYNPNGSAVDVEAFTGDDPSSVDTTLTIPAGGYDTYVLPQGSANGAANASRVQSTNGEDIYVLAAMDACDDAHDWGGMLLPDDNLTSAMLIPLGFGSDPTLETTGNENHSPVWVTPTADTFIYVDFNGDLVPDEVDLNGDGDTSDTIDGISESTSDEGMSVSELQLLRIHDPSDQDQSGTLVFSLTTGGYTGGDATGRIAGATLAGGWGQDLDTANPGGTPLASPSIDVGVAFAPITFPANLPVTLDRFSSRQIGNRIRFAWGTASETFTVGFNLWGKVDGEWRQLNRRLMVNRMTDSTTPQRYRRSVRTPDRDLEFVGISSVDTDGSEHFYGPFELNRRYGSSATPDPIPWNEIRAELNQRMRERGYVETSRGRGFRRLSWLVRRLEEFRDRYPVFHLETRSEGIHRLTYEQLRQAGVDLRGVPSSEMAMTHKGEPVPVYVHNGFGRRFGRGSYIDFYAAPVDAEDMRYTDTNVYQLHVDGRRALRSGIVVREPDPRDAPGYYIESIERDVNRGYSLNMPAAEPWYEHRLIGVPGDRVGEASVDLELEGLASGVSDPRIGVRVGMAGIADFTGASGPDHRVRIYLNDGADPIADVTNDGIVDWPVETAVPASRLNEGVNTIRLEVPGVEGRPFDLVYGDTYAIDYPREFSAVDNALSFTEDARSFRVAGFNRRNVVAYATEGDNLARLRVETRRWRGQVIADLSGIAQGEATYWVSTEDALASPEVMVDDRSADLVNPAADYIIIAHPSFVDVVEQAQDFLAAKREQGYAPHIVNVYDIYNQYGYGMPVPGGIRRYLQAQDAANEIAHVLLVGGATSDPKNYTGLNSVDFVPTVFARTGDLILHTPSDGLLVDLHGAGGGSEPDGVPDHSIGRWPVRTVAELQTIIDKTLQYQQNLAARRSVMLVADLTDEEFPAFSSQTDRVAEKLATPGTPPQPWTDVTRVYADDFPSMAATQQALIDGFGAGQALTLYSGHGSTSGWSFDGLLDWEAAQSLDNTGQPTLIGTMSCYTTYFVAPGTDNIGHQLLMSGDRGAALIHGAATLSGFSQNEALLGRAVDAMVSGQSVGEGVVTARQALGRSYYDVITNWSVLGDPSLAIEP